MRKSSFEETERDGLLPHLKVTLCCLKSLHVAVSALMADVAAIRNTMFDDPENIDRYQSHLKLALATAKPMVDDAMRSYDELIQGVVDSQQWKN
ncbi:MAG: hypothetical protein WBL63_12635 [Candidatus Acidiferrum sp.]